MLLIVAATVIVVRLRKEFAEVLEDWEIEYGPHSFSYKELFRATKVTIKAYWGPEALGESTKVSCLL